jgi:hypothetical protein
MAESAAKLLLCGVCTLLLLHPSNAGNLHVCTFATHAEFGFCDSLRSALQNSLRVTVAGWGEKKKTYPTGSHPTHYSGPKMGKPSALLKCIQSVVTTDPDATVMIIDGFDVLFQKGEPDILATYKGPSIIYNAEKTCWPFNYLAKVSNGSRLICRRYDSRLPASTAAVYPNGTAPRYLNSGAAIGPAKSMAAWYDKLLLMFKQIQFFSDQHATSTLFSVGGFDVELDYDSTLFQTMHASMDDVVQDEAHGMFKNRLTGKEPALFHFNGDHAPLTDFATKLWYSKEGAANISDRGFMTTDGAFVTYSEACP